MTHGAGVRVTHGLVDAEVSPGEQGEQVASEGGGVAGPRDHSHVQRYGSWRYALFDRWRLSIIRGCQ